MHQWAVVQAVLLHCASLVVLECALKSLMHVTGIVNYISKSVFRHQNMRGGGGLCKYCLCSPLSSLFKDTNDSLIRGNFLLTGLEKGTRSYLLLLSYPGYVHTVQPDPRNLQSADTG